MAGKKIIAIIGATGAQGGGLARAILSDPASPYSVRAITRDATSDKAKALAEMGAEIVTADVNDAESLRSAFDGAYGAFCVTFFWEHFSPEKEIAQATNMADAALQAGVEHVIWSTLEDTREWIALDDDRMPTLMERYKVPHFDGKGEADKVFLGKQVPVTCLRTSFYWDNFVYFGMGPKPNPDGSLAITIPMGEAKLPGIAAEDIGKCALGIFERGNELLGKTVGIAGEHLTAAEMAGSLSEAFGVPVQANPVTPEMYRGFGFEGADDLGNMFQFKRDFEADFRGVRDVEFSRSLNPSLLTFEQWLSRNKSLIPMGE